MLTDGSATHQNRSRTTRTARRDTWVGTALLTGQQARIGDLLGKPENATVAQFRLVGYLAEGADAGGRRPYGELYFDGQWGTPLHRDPAVVQDLQGQRGWSCGCSAIGCCRAQGVGAG